MKWSRARNLAGLIRFGLRQDKGIYKSDDGRFVAGAVGSPNGWGGMKQRWELRDIKTGQRLGQREGFKKIKELALIRAEEGWTV
jgi:hypothetical protein